MLNDRVQQHKAALQDYRKALKLNPELAEGPGWLDGFSEISLTLPQRSPIKQIAWKGSSRSPKVSDSFGCRN
jgi:hypothetical protein